MTGGEAQPLFLLSLPRSGSTLLQRLLASHPDIATASEPWLLLPLVYTLRSEGAYAEYGHRQMVRAVSDFWPQLDGGREEYLGQLGAMAQRLYAGAGGGKRYFLDKTPRYHLIVSEVIHMFPDSRFIFLWRNPLAVAASMIESFGQGSWNLSRYSIDLEDGLRNLVEACASLADRAIVVRYEDLVQGSEREVHRVWRALGLDWDPLAQLFASERPCGRMGDRTGALEYTDISAEPLDKWRATLGTAYRRRWAIRYLARMGRDTFEAMGYDFSKLERDARELSTSVRCLGPDVVRTAHDRALGWMAQSVTRNSLRGAPPPRGEGRPSS